MKLRNIAGFITQHPLDIQKVEISMQNKKVALAVAAALAIPAAAHADTTIYGFLSGGVESTKATGGPAGKEYSTTTRVVDNNSRIGFKGDEDLGNGLKTIWQVESSLRNFEQGGTNDKGDSATLATRNTFIGLQSSAWGTVQLGQYDSAYKRLTNVGLNVLADTTADTQNAVSIFSHRETRLKNSVHYTSPVFSGFQAGASYGWDEVAAPKSDNRYSIAAQYNNAGLVIGAGYDSEGSDINKGTAGQINTTNGWKLAAAYTIPGVGTLVGAGFERVTNKVTGGSDQNQNDWLIAVAQPFGAFTLKAAYGQQGGLSNPSTGSSDDYKATQWVLGGSYDLSKKTQAYVYATRINNHSKAKVDFNVNPVYTSGQGTAAAALDAGNDPQAFGIGLKTVF
jgi:predicted porin